MISYVECLSGEGAGPVMTSHCWNRGPDEERDELLPRKMAALQPKTEGSLRRRLLSAKIHQQHDAILGLNGLNGGAGRPGSGPLPPHLQYLGNSPWHLAARPHVHPSLTPDAHNKLFLVPDPYAKPRPQYPPAQVPRSGSGYYFPPQEPHLGSAPLGGTASLTEPEVPPQYRYQPSRGPKTSFFCFQRRRGRSSRQEALQTTPLLHKGDGDSRWSVHYDTQKPQHGLRFIPGKNASSSTEHLSASYRLNENGYSGAGSSQSRPLSPNISPYFSLDQSEGRNSSRWGGRRRKMSSRLRDFLSQSCFSVCFKSSVWRRESSASSDEEERLFLSHMRPMTPLVLNPVSAPSSWDGFSDQSPVTMEMETNQRLPTPEERMRQQAEAVAADIVPINVTGESFDRQASFRRSLSNTDSLTRQPRKINRRKTVSDLPADVLPKSPVCVDLPGQFSTVGRAASSACTSARAQVEDRADLRTDGQSKRKIRAPKGEGMSSLMASLTSSPHLSEDPRSYDSCPSPNSSCGALSLSPSHCQDVQGFPSDLRPRLPFDPSARVVPQSPSSSPPSPLLDWSPPSPPSLCSESEFSYLSPIGPPQGSEDWPCDPSPWSLDRDRKSSVSSSGSVARRISLRKSTHPPPPPARSDSLRRRPGRSRTSSPRLDRTPLGGPVPPPPVPPPLEDPWVPRTRAVGAIGIVGTVTTFEPLPPPLSPAPPGSAALRLALKHPPDPAPAGLRRLASPSSGYSSQSNTPTPGTPVASPPNPSSPLTAPPGRNRPKPPVPERKSSLLSSLSSSYSSTSSLSSYTSSDSARHPPLPPPPPLPPSSPPLPPFSFTKHPVAPNATLLPPPSSSLPPPPLPPPLPPFSFTKHPVAPNATLLPSPSSSLPPFSSSSPAPLPPFSSPSPAPLSPFSSPSPAPLSPFSSPSPAPLPPFSSPSPAPLSPFSSPSPAPLPPFSSPSPAPLPPFSSPSLAPLSPFSSPSPAPLPPFSSPSPAPPLPPPTRTPPPYSYAVRTSSRLPPAFAAAPPPSSPPPPTPPSPLSSSELLEDMPDLPPPPPPLPRTPSPSGPAGKAASPHSLLVTTQALQRVKLRPVKPPRAAYAAHDGPPAPGHVTGTLPEPPPGPDPLVGARPASESTDTSPERLRGPGTPRAAGVPLSSGEDSNSDPCPALSPWVKLGHGTGGYQHQHPPEPEDPPVGSDATKEVQMNGRNRAQTQDLPEARADGESVLAGTWKVRSPEKPVPPKKPDLQILDLMASPKLRRGPGGSPPRSPAGSPQRQKPQILHRKPDLSPKTHRSLNRVGTLEPTGLTRTRPSGETTLEALDLDGHRGPVLTSRTGAAPEEEDTSPRRPSRSSLADDEDEDERERAEERARKATMTTMTMTSSGKKVQVRRRRRRKRSQLVMMSSKSEPSPSSSSSSSSSSSISSSEEEREPVRVKRERARAGRAFPQETSDSDSSCAVIGRTRSRLSLSSTPSSDSLQGEPALPDLLIQEPGEEGGPRSSEEETDVTRTSHGDSLSRGGPLVGVSADQVLVSGRPRTTEDLFAVIHSAVWEGTA